MITFCNLLRLGVQYLEEHEIENASLDAWYLMEFVWEMDRSYYFAHANDIIVEEKRKRYIHLLEGRSRHIPLQQLTHRAYFMGLCFFVDEHVLIPRQDTEVLVEWVLQKVTPGCRVLDMCTGSGCILLSILHENHTVQGLGVDISPEALQIAKKNARRLGIPADFVESDLFEEVNETFDIIVANPPYIPAGVIPTLMKEVKDHEPVLALDGKEDGLYFYRKIIGRAEHYLNKKGSLAFEIGHDQGDALRQMLLGAGYEDVQIIKDLAGLDRVAIGQRP